MEVRETLKEFEPESDLQALVLQVSGRMNLHGLAFVVELVAGVHLHVRQSLEIRLVL